MFAAADDELEFAEDELTAAAPVKPTPEKPRKDNLLGLGDIDPERLHRFQLVKQGKWYGWFDHKFEYQELVSEDKETALEALFELRRSTDKLKFP